MDIRCRKLCCKHNKGQTCVLDGFTIGEEKCCENYKFDACKEAVDVSSKMFEEKLNYAPFKNIKKFNLKCDATNCIFNEEKHCHSNGITILSKDEKKATCCNYFPN